MLYGFHPNWMKIFFYFAPLPPHEEVLSSQWKGMEWYSSFQPTSLPDEFHGRPGFHSMNQIIVHFWLFIGPKLSYSVLVVPTYAVFATNSSCYVTYVHKRTPSHQIHKIWKSCKKKLKTSKLARWGVYIGVRLGVSGVCTPKRSIWGLKGVFTPKGSTSGHCGNILQK